MAYNSFPNAYPQYYPQYAPNPMQVQQSQVAPTQMSGASQANNSNRIWVQGEAGAKSYLVAPNTTVDLWDSESQTIYIKSADVAGLPSMRIIDYTIRDNATRTPKFASNSDFITKDDILPIEERLTAIEGKLEGIATGTKKTTAKKEVKDE